MYVMFNKDDSRVLCQSNDLKFWSGNLRFTDRVTPILYNSKIKALFNAWLCEGTVVKYSEKEIPEDDYFLGNYEYFWVVDKRTGEVSKTRIDIMLPLHKELYKIVKWD